MDEKEKRNRAVDLGIIIALLIAIASFFVFSAGMLVGRTPNTTTQKDKNIKLSNDAIKKEEKEQPVPTNAEENKEIENQDGRYKIGETWTVDGQWSLTVNSVQETAERNEYSDTHPAAVYIVTYTYTNLGKSGGLFLSMENKIVDSSGKMGYSYPGNLAMFPQDAPVGATCEAQACIGVDNPGSFEIYMDEYDDAENKQSAVFSIEF